MKPGGEVAEHARYGFYVNSILQRNRSKGVAEVVESDFGDACSGEDSFQYIVPRRVQMIISFEKLLC